MFRGLIGVVLAIASVCGAAASSARADLVQTDLRDYVGDFHSTSLTAGSTFDVVVELNITGAALSAGQFKLGTTASADGIFTINSISFGPDFTNDPNFTLNPAVQTLNAGNSYKSGDIGSIAADLNLGAGPGTVLFATIQIAVSNGAAQGNYFLSLSDLAFGNVSFDPVSSQAGGSYRVSVIPSPGAAILGVIGLVFVGRRRAA